MTPMALRRVTRAPDETVPTTLEDLLSRVGRGDTPAFELLYDRVAGSVFGVVRRVLRDPAQSEEVAQEVLVEVWRTATRFDLARGSAATWIHTMAHRRAIDRVRASQASHDREQRIAVRDHVPPYDEVADQVETRLEQEQVRKCLGGLTDIQRESVTLAYYGGYTYSQVAGLLDVPLGTVKTRMRDGLIRLRDCLGVTA
jgi:RNA polymerase sigma-70 factor (ECF subfamily)